MTPQSTHKICATITQWLNELEPQNPNWSPQEWESFKLVCRVHGIAPLLYKNIKQATWLKADIQPWLAEQYAFNAQRITKMQQELAEILALFANKQIPLMPLKGSILGLKFYQDPAYRPMADLDLLIRAADFEVSAHLLTQLGYEPDITHWKHTEFSKADNRQVINPNCEHPHNPRKLEIHLQCRENFGGPMINLTELMWKNAYQGSLLGQSAIIPKLEALYLHLLIHCTYHLWQGKGRLIHLVDLTHITPQLSHPVSILNGIDARFTYPALAMLNKYFPTTLDKTLLTQQQKQVSPKFQEWVAGLDLVNTSYLNPNPTGLYLTKALKFTEGRPTEIMQAFRFALLPRLEEMALDHPKLSKSKAPWLAYCLLPLDWLKRMTHKS